MSNKKLFIVIIVVIAFAGFILFTKVTSPKTKSTQTTPTVQTKKDSKKDLKKDLKKINTQKVISKGKGALTIRIANSRKAEIPMRIKAFKVIDARSSVYATSSVGGRMQEVMPGTYDIEIDTIPQKILKNIRVAQGKETIEDLGCVTGSLSVRTSNVKKTAAYYPMRILYSKTNDMVTAYMTNKSIDIVPGVYDIEVGTSPRLYKKDVKVDAGKDTLIDMGCVVGSLRVKAVDESGRDVRLSVRITRADTNEIVSSAKSNRPIDLGKGSYNIEILSNPKQSRGNVKVSVGEESVAEFIIKSPIPTPNSVKPKTKQ